MPLRLKSPSRPWPIASWSSTPGQPGPSTTVISPAGRGDQFEVHQRLGESDVDRPAPGRRLEQAVVEIAAAEAVIAALAPPVLLDDDLDVEADLRPDVVGDEAVGADDLDHRPGAGQGDRDLDDSRIARPGRRVDLLAERDLPGEGHEAERIGIGIEGGVGPARRRRAGRPWPGRAPPSSRRPGGWRLPKARWHGRRRWSRPTRREGRSPPGCRNPPSSAGRRRSRRIRRRYIEGRARRRRRP